MKCCSICKIEGHNKSNTKFHPKEEKPKIPKEEKPKIPKKLLTEDLGKKTEYALCLLLDTPYKSKSGYKYSIEEAEKIKTRMIKVKEYLNYDTFEHTGESSKLHDFTGKDNNFLSVKTNKHKNDWKICPQIIGQPTKKKFCEYFELPVKSSDAKIKEFIIENIAKILKSYFENSFHCPILYYNEAEDKVMIIKKKSDVDWDKIDYKFSYQDKKDGYWNESNTIYCNKESKKISIGEFQFHANRDSIKFRFFLKNLIKNFQDNLEVTEF